MALLSSKKKAIEKNIELKIDASLLDEINHYIKFAKLESMDEFFSEATRFVLSKDSEWKKVKKSKS